MAGKARTKSELEKKGDIARKALADAKAAHEKNANAATKANLDKAALAAKDATKAENTERFDNIAGARVSIIAAKIAAFAKTSNRRAYEYSADEIEQAFKYIESEIAAAKETFENALKSPGKVATPGKSFSFKK